MLDTADLDGEKGKEGKKSERYLSHNYLLRRLTVFWMEYSKIPYYYYNNPILCETLPPITSTK